MQPTEQKTLEISETAAKRIAALLKSEKNPDSRLRISVDGGGCSGFQYKFGFDATRSDDDIVIEKQGVEVVIDPMSLGFVAGSQLNFVETLGAAHFEIKNPNATATCGCGNSFAV